MFKKLVNAFTIFVFIAGIFGVTPGSAAPVVDETPGPSTQAEDTLVPRGERNSFKPDDQPNLKDYLRNQDRQRLLEAGQTAEAAALTQTGTDRVLVVLVDFAGTDVFTWTAPTNPNDPTTGSQWDPFGRVDPSEFTGVVGDCSNIITQTTVFTFTGPLYNQIPRPLSPSDRSGDSIWTEDFSPDWFDDFMFGNGVVISYTMVDGTPVFEDFTGESVKNYYSDMSGGVYTVTGDVVGWLQLPHSTQYYDADECPGDRSGTSVQRGGMIPGAGNARTLVRDALDLVNAEITAGHLPGFDWHDYDQDGDGIIDRLWIVHSGYGEEDGDVLLNRTSYGESAVWSHSSAVTPPYPVAADVAAGPYIVMPENGGIGVFAHEYGHNLGADDLYAYSPEPETSAGFWTLMADDWTGYPIGFEPPSVDPWHLDNWGWLNPMVITDTSQVYEFTIGQASSFPGGQDVYRGGKIVLADQSTPQDVPIWQGSYYWWGGKKDVSNAMMTTANPVAIPAGATAATLSFDLVYDIEDYWDFLWVQVSSDGGTTWETLTNANTICTHDPAWIGSLYGFPDDLCGAGIGGFTTYNANWPDPELQTFDLSGYAGQNLLVRFWYMTDWATTYTGSFVDNVDVTVDSASVFSDNAEAGDALWVYDYPWERSDGMIRYTHNFFLQWRNTNANGGYDSALGDPRWRYGPANTGLLVWYNNNAYTENEIFYPTAGINHLLDDPSFGPKGRMLVVDSHPDPYRDPYYIWMGYNNEGGNVPSRSLMRDAPFTLADTVGFTMKPPSVYAPTVFTGRPAVTSFHDSMGYYGGAEYVNRGPFYPPTQRSWVTKQWDASVVMPSTVPYGLNAPGYPGNVTFRFDCSKNLPAGSLLCYGYGAGLGVDGSSGNPGDFEGNLGWHVQILEEAPDHSWARVRVWNAKYDFDDTLAPATTAAADGDEVAFAYEINQNIGAKVNAFVAIPLDTTAVEYVPGSAYGGIVPLPTGYTLQQVTDLYTKGGMAALQAIQATSGDVGMLVWTGHLATAQAAPEMGFKVKVKLVIGSFSLTASAYNEGVWFKDTGSATVIVTPAHQIFVPTIVR